MILDFKGGGIFRNHPKSRDKSYDLLAKKNLPRSSMKQFIEPITVYQVSNVVHVLFGERPTPTLRVVCYDRVEYLFEKAKNSFLRIDTPKTKNGNLIGEVIITNKSSWNSWSTEINANWKVIENYLEEDYFKKLKTVLSDVFGESVLSETFLSLIPKIKNSEDERLIEFMADISINGKKAFKDLIESTNPNVKSNINRSKRSLLTTPNGLDTIYRLSGKIMVPVTDEDLIKLSNNSGFATFLDGGYLTIESIKDSDSVDDYGFTKVSDISIEME